MEGVLSIIHCTPYLVYFRRFPRKIPSRLSDSVVMHRPLGLLKGTGNNNQAVNHPPPKE